MEESKQTESESEPAPLLAIMGRYVTLIHTFIGVYLLRSSHDCFMLLSYAGSIHLMTLAYLLPIQHLSSKRCKIIAMEEKMEGLDSMSGMGRC